MANGGSHHLGEEYACLGVENVLYLDLGDSITVFTNVKIILYI